MLAIKNAKLHTITNGVQDGHVLIDDQGRITAVGQVEIPAEAEVIDAAGRILTPGLIDPHGHAGVYEEGLGWEGADGNEAVDPVTPHVRALDGINPHDEGILEALQGGVTAMCVLPGSANVIGGQGVVIHLHGNTVEEMMIKENGGLKVAFGENPKRVYSNQKKSPSTRMATAAILRENLVKAQNYLAKLEKAKTDPDKEPERDLRLEVLAKALKRELPVRAHAHRADDIMTALRIAKEFNLDISIEHCTEGHKIVDELREAGVWAIVGPTLSNRSKVELKELSFDTLRVLWEGGISVAITMDHPVIPVGYLPTAAAYAVKAGLPYEEALKAITINPAKILGIDDRYGSIEVGKMADLVLWSGDPLAIQSRVEKVLIHGRVVFQH
ncbi:MAG TPA: amidohydrolase [Firmicutes bacterium]|nr:amidohydrolase [Bacillota bacterium]HHT43357.1 amidohydrolase [Bacillota bacterium]